MLNTSTIPLPPSLAALSIPERMLEVIRRNAHEGQPTTERDFLDAEETCDLSVDQLHAHIGAAKRLANKEVVRHDQPASPLQPWDFDTDYRKERVRLAAASLAGIIPSETDMFALLRHGDRFTATELGALWSEIMAETTSLFGRTRTSVMARIIVDLTRATDAYAEVNTSAAAAELVTSMRVVLAALHDQQQLPRAHVLQTVRALVGDVEQSILDLRIVDATRSAYGALSELWAA